jgi:MAE_28990/MAE_18760-like HEPN
MKEIIKEFKLQVKEVNLYFDFIKSSVENDVYLSSATKAWRKPVTSEIQKILKANFFLILYNLIEATIRKSILEIYDALREDGIHYKLAKPEIQKIFLDYYCKRIRETSNNKFTERISELLQDTLNDTVIELNIESIPISGNLDARKVRELARAYGFSETVSKAKRAGADLMIVKEQRNSLAHGLKTFSECGRNYSIRDLKNIKDEVIRYLEDILKNIKTYIDNKEYRL